MVDERDDLDPLTPRPAAARPRLSWWLVMGVIACGIAVGGAATLILWRYKATEHKDALDIGMKITLAVVGLLGVVLGVRRYNLSVDEHQRQMQVDTANQQHAEALLQRQIAADEATRQDAIARQITELSSKASEQLGSEKAAVRLGGLADLERLAQSHPELRQTVVDRICAYLCAPYDPPTENTSESGAALVEQRLEFHVRRTAQRILERHLRRSNQVSHWPDISLDLRDATLIEVDLADCTVTNVRAERARFYDSADFRRTIFAGYVRFDSAQFNSVARFEHATFRRTVNFGSALFAGGARFNGANFNERTSFVKSKFTALANFTQSVFLGAARFDECAFLSLAVFRWTVFHDITLLGTAHFNGDPDFADSIVRSGANFQVPPDFYLQEILHPEHGPVGTVAKVKRKD